MNKFDYPKNRSSPKKRAWFFFSSLGLILAVWSLLYLPNLRTSPPWYGDEIFSLDIGKSLSHGVPANRALYCTFFSYAAQYQPVFVFCIGVAANLTHGDILGGRLLTVCIGLATALLGFWFFHRKFGFFCGLSFAFLLLGYSQSIIHYRWIYPHNLVGLSVLGAVAVLMRPARLPADWKAGAFLALGAGSHFLGVLNTFFLTLFRVKYPRSMPAVFLPPIILFGATFAWSTYLFKGLPAEDFLNLLRIYNQHSLENAGGLRFLTNFFYFYTQDFFHVITLFCTFLCLRRRTTFLALSVLGMSFLLLRNRQNLPYFYYQAMTVLPLFCAVTAVGLYRTMNLAWKGLGFKRKSLRRARICLPVGCLVLALLNLPSVLQSSLPVRIMPFVVKDIPGYESAAKWINERTNSDDLVIAYWNFGWMLHCRNSDILMSVAWLGVPGGDVFDPPPRRDQYRYPAGIEFSKYFVVTEQDLLWSFHQRNVQEVLQRFRVFEWPLVFETESLKVFQNPNPLRP